MKPSLRFEVFKRDAFTCRYCGKRSPEAILEVDHVNPLSASGTDEIENLVTSCYECNRGKGAKLLSDIPQESDLHEKTILIAEQERQIAELYHWRATQRNRENDELKKLEAVWESYWQPSRNGYSAWRWTNARTFLRHMGYVDVLEALEIALDYHALNEQRRWKYFCGICWNKIKEGGE